MSSNYVDNSNLLAQIAATPMTSDKSSSGTAWFEAMAKSWGDTLDAQANRITQQSDAISAGDNTPSAITQLTTLSLEMGFLSNSSHSSITSVGEALSTTARKQ